MFVGSPGVLNNKGLIRFKKIPSAPSDFSAFCTIVPSDIHVPSQSFLNTLHGMSAGTAYDIKTSGSFSDGFTLRDYTPPGPTYYRFVNTSGDVFGSASLADHAIDAVIDADWQAFYGLDALNPPVLRSQTQNGMQLSSRVGGSHYLIQNYVVDNPGASGFTANFGVGGGRTYAWVLLSFYRSFGAGEEGICYIGHTSSPYDDVDIAIVHDCFSTDSNREGTQTEHVNKLFLYNNTVHISGQSGIAGQKGLIQLHDV